MLIQTASAILISAIWFAYDSAIKAQRKPSRTTRNPQSDIRDRYLHRIMEGSYDGTLSEFAGWCEHPQTLKAELTIENADAYFGRR